MIDVQQKNDAYRTLSKIESFGLIETKKGGCYLSFYDRLMWFKKVCPDAVVITTLEPSPQAGAACFKAEVYLSREDKVKGLLPASVGHGIRDSEIVLDTGEKISYADNAANQAINDALKKLGFFRLEEFSRQVADAGSANTTNTSEKAPVQQPPTATIITGDDAEIVANTENEQAIMDLLS